MNKILKTASAREEITSRSGGSTRYNVGQEILKDIELLYPSQIEQQKINEHFFSKYKSRYEKLSENINVILISNDINSRERINYDYSTKKRISSLTKTEIERNINKNISIEGLSIEGMKIHIKDDKINIEYNWSLYDFSREEFNRKPRVVI